MRGYRFERARSQSHGFQSNLHFGVQTNETIAAYIMGNVTPEAILNFQTLTKAPIKEALIAIRIEPANTRLDVLEQICSRLPDVYQTQRSPISLSQTQINMGPDAPATANVEQRQLGWRLTARDGRYALQARIDYFIFSHLAPYSRWPDFLDEARKIWGVFREFYTSTNVRAVTVKNINEVNLSLGESVEKYLNFYINVPEGVPQQFRNYFARIELIQDADTIATLQSGLLPPVSDKVPILLDIEVTRTITPRNDDELWLAVNGLREPKNQIFFSCITREWEAKLR